MVERLANLIAIFQKPELDFSKNRAEHDDILGDAYEYLMRHFATQSGKSKGQFYTPSEVSRSWPRSSASPRRTPKACTTAYDPTCGSGSLLLKVAAEAGKHITLEGQEKDVTTAGLARMNMILHDFPTANIVPGNTLSAPKFKDGEQLRTYDYVVANPPFSDKSWSTGLTPEKDHLQRFAWGVPPAKQGDYAYLLHIVRSMKSTGKGRLHSAARRPLSRQCRSRHPQPARSFRLPQGHHRPACQPLLRHRHPGLHPRARQGKRHCPQGHLHDRRLQGFHERRPQEPPARARHSPHCRCLRGRTKATRALPASCRLTRLPPRTTSISTCRAISTARSLRICRTLTAICAAASRRGTSTRSATTGTSAQRSVPRCSSRGPAGLPSCGWPSQSQARHLRPPEFTAFIVGRTASSPMEAGHLAVASQASRKDGHPKELIETTPRTCSPRSRPRRSWMPTASISI